MITHGNDNKKEPLDTYAHKHRYTANYGDKKISQSVNLVIQHAVHK